MSDQAERRLEGQVFHVSYNNGVDALVSDAVLADLIRWGEISSASALADSERSVVEEGLAHLLAGPVFTFTSRERFMRNPWFTGDDAFRDVLIRHIRDLGGHVQERSFNVPFSNGSEVGLHGPDGQSAELRYATTEREFHDTFGVSTAYIRRGASARREVAA